MRRRVATRLFEGLGARPPNYPQRVPIFLVRGRTEGVTMGLCAQAGKVGAVVSVGAGRDESAQVVAHELFHAYSEGAKAKGLLYPWFDDSGAEWSTWKAGWRYPETWDVTLQYPEKPADTLADESHRYAMWRFVQFLDDKGMIVAGDNSWPLIRSVIVGYPQMTAALEIFLTSVGTKLGRELAEFWGQHLKARPPRPPQVKPAPGINSRRVTIKAEDHVVKASTCGLCTSLDDFVLAKDVKRVEFEFEPPADGYFWGLVAPNDSRRFESKSSISFCVDGSDEDDLEWPGHFPVTFTSGIQAHDVVIEGDIFVYAQSTTDQCKQSAPNRACKVAQRAGAGAVFGREVRNPPVGFQGSSGVEEDGQPYVNCLYGGINGFLSLQINRWKSSAKLRAAIRKVAKDPCCSPFKLGDAAAIIDLGNHVSLSTAIGREEIVVQVTAESGARAKAVEFGRAVVKVAR